MVIYYFFSYILVWLNLKISCYLPACHYKPLSVHHNSRITKTVSYVNLDVLQMFSFVLFHTDPADLSLTLKLFRRLLNQAQESLKPFDSNPFRCHSDESGSERPTLPTICLSQTFKVFGVFFFSFFSPYRTAVIFTAVMSHEDMIQWISERWVTAAFMSYFWVECLMGSQRDCTRFWGLRETHWCVWELHEEPVCVPTPLKCDFRTWWARRGVWEKNIAINK